MFVSFESKSKPPVCFSVPGDRQECLFGMEKMGMFEYWPCPPPVGIDRDSVASGRPAAAPGLGWEGTADTAKDGKETAAH